MSTLLPCINQAPRPLTSDSRIEREPRRFTSLLLCALLFLPTLSKAHSQGAPSPIQVHERAKPRIAVFPFDDRTTANKDMNIGTKVADEIIAKLATNSNFIVYDRNHVDRLLQGKKPQVRPQL